jgi:hypothetical protein
MLFHVLNRGVGRMRLFLKDGDFEAFELAVGQPLAADARNRRTGRAIERLAATASALVAAARQPSAE